MPSSDPSRPNYRRRMFWLATFIVVLFGGYSVGWFYVGSLLESRTAAALADISRNGVSADCANPTARGFPFRIGLYCDSVAFADENQGAGVRAGNFRSAAQVYDPLQVVGELDGPAHVALADAGSFDIDWGLLHASARLATPLPERVSVEATDIKAGPSSRASLFVAKQFEAHMRPSGSDLDLALSFRALTFDSSVLAGRDVPPLSGQVDATVTGGAALLTGSAADLRGRTGTIRALELSTEPSTGIAVTGTVAVDEAGLIDADLMLTIRSPKSLAAAASKAFPEARNQIENSLNGLAAMGDNPSLPLRIVKGKASLGFIPLGEIPPL